MMTEEEIEALRTAPMKRSVFTFGMGHPYANHYVVIEAPDPRIVMVRQFGRCWSHEYLDEAAAGVERFNLQPLPAIVADRHKVVEWAYDLKRKRA